jgi:hypothetical protein
MGGTVGSGAEGRPGDAFSVECMLDNMFDSTVEFNVPAKPVTATVALNGVTPVSTAQLPVGRYKVYVEGGDNAFSILLWKGVNNSAAITVPTPGAKGSNVLSMRADEIERMYIDDLTSFPLQFVWIAATTAGKTNLVYFVQLTNE